MNWENVKFSARDLIVIITNIIIGASWILAVKSDIRILFDGNKRIETQLDKMENTTTARMSKMEVDLGELRLRVALLEQKLNEYEVHKQ